MMKKLNFKTLILTMLMIVGGGNSVLGESTFTFTQSSNSKGTLKGAPQGVTATFSSTYTNGYQLTKNNSMTLTLSGFASNIKLTGITLTVKNNKSSGKGVATAKIGDTTIGTMAIEGLGNTYTDKAMEITPMLVTGNLVVTISASENSAYCDKFTFTYEEESEVPVAVATPTFSVESGTYEEAQTVEIACETEDATIYYTLDGTEPTNESTKYAGAITVSETTTIKAIAYNVDGEASKVASATYTFPVVYENIAAFKEANTTGYLNLTGAQIVYIDGNKVNIYVRDASGATSLYKKEGFDVDFKTGDMLNGIIKATNGDYNGQPQLNNADLTKLTVSGNEVVVAKVIDGTTEAIAANLCDLVKIENTTITSNGTRYYVGKDKDVQLYDQFKAGLNFTADKAADVQGIAAVYYSTYELFPRFESDIVYLDNSVPVEIGAAGMATFSCDKALDFTGTDAIYAYTATLDGTTVNFKRVRKVPAATGVLLRNPLGESAVEAVNVPVIDNEDAEDVSDNAFVAALEEIASLPTEQDGTNYILNKVGGKLGFYKAAGKKVGAGKAYLKVPAGTTPNAVIAISFDGDVTTGILTIDHEQQPGASGAYDLQGRRVAQPTKGLYIVNGKK